MVAPNWLQVFASWLNLRVNYGRRRHLVHFPAEGCYACWEWRLHDEAFHDEGGWSLTPLGVLMQEAGRR